MDHPVYIGLGAQLAPESQQCATIIVAMAQETLFELRLEPALYGLEQQACYGNCKNERGGSAAWNILSEQIACQRRDREIERHQNCCCERIGGTASQCNIDFE